jgi:hypothetical protein
MQLYTAVRANIEYVASRDWCIPTVVMRYALRFLASNFKFFVLSLDLNRVALADRLHGALKMVVGVPD